LARLATKAIITEQFSIVRAGAGERSVAVEKQEAVKGNECLGCLWRTVTAGCVSHKENEEVGHLDKMWIEKQGVSPTLFENAFSQRIALVLSIAV
jgi:hypothetical protein